MCKSKKDKNTGAPGPSGGPAQPPPPPPPPPTIRDSVTTSDHFKNPLNDPAIATKLTQVNPGETIATAEQFDKERTYKIFVPKKLATDFFNAPAASKPKARVSLFYGVGPEMTLFRMREFFANENNSVLIAIPGVEHGVGWEGVKIPFGVGISKNIIDKLMTKAGLGGIDFSVETMAGYSTGYRGTNLTIINELIDLSKLTRVIYLDAWFHHDDHPKGPAPFTSKNTRWACETALTKSAAAKIIIYGFTHPGGVPRTNPTQANQAIENPPTEPIASLSSKFPGRVVFIDFEFKFQTRPAIDVALEKICLARLIQLGLGGRYQLADVSAALLPLINALPARGSFGTLGLPSFTDLYAWVPAHTSELSGFDIADAMTMVTTHRLLDTWSIGDHYEFRHREFVLELGKEPLVP